MSFLVLVGWMGESIKDLSNRYCTDNAIITKFCFVLRFSSETVTFLKAQFSKKRIVLDKIIPFWGCHLEIFIKGSFKKIGIFNWKEINKIIFLMAHTLWSIDIDEVILSLGEND